MAPLHTARDERRRDPPYPQPHHPHLRRRPGADRPHVPSVERRGMALRPDRAGLVPPLPRGPSRRVLLPPVVRSRRSSPPAASAGSTSASGCSARVGARPTTTRPTPTGRRRSPAAADGRASGAGRRRTGPARRAGTNSTRLKAAASLLSPTGRSNSPDRISRLSCGARIHAEDMQEFRPPERRSDSRNGGVAFRCADQQPGKARPGTGVAGTLSIRPDTL